MHGQAARLGLGNGDFLHRVLQIRAAGFQLLGQIGAVQQLEGGGLVAPKPTFEQTRDPLAGVHAIKVLRRHAGRAGVLRRGLGAALFGRALGQDRHRTIIARVRVTRLLGHAHRPIRGRNQELLGELQRVSPVFCGQLQSH